MPYRMPIWYLPAAVVSMRDCALRRGPYVNPFAKVDFGAWRPATTYETKWMRPDEDTLQFTSFQFAMDVVRAVTRKNAIEFDFVRLAPCVADYSRSGFLIQDKTDTYTRRNKTDFTSVQVSRDNEKGRR